MSPLWIFDLDNTLYPAESGLFKLVDARIVEFMAQKLKLDRAGIPRLRELYWKTYGLTMVGLMAHHGVDPVEYLAFVHDVPVEEVLSPDPALAEALALLPGRRVIFTNGSEGHVRTVLSRLGVDGLIEAVFDVVFMDYQPKPRPHGYEKLLRTLGVDARACWLIDDLPANLDTGRSLGMETVLVATEPHDGHRHVRSVRELPSLLGFEAA
jgi:putative hydrolase of the HAD superfamily